MVIGSVLMIKIHQVANYVNTGTVSNGTLSLHSPSPSLDAARTVHYKLMQDWHEGVSRALRSAKLTNETPYNSVK